MGLTEWNRIYLHYTVIGGIEYEIHTVSQCDEVNSDYIHLSHIKGIFYFGMSMIEWNSIYLHFTDPLE
jgi:hypothetical protein